jgi:alpha,alpha-trehalase
MHRLPDLTLPLAIAAYQVGLSFLTVHMRRAVAACTSPEVFFGANAIGASGESTLLTNNFSPSDPLAYAMENLDISVPFI